MAQILLVADQKIHMICDPWASKSVARTGIQGGSSFATVPVRQPNPEAAHIPPSDH